MKYQNLHLADMSLFMQYRTLFKTNILGAQTLLADSQLNNKYLTATDINDITGDISTLETYYNTNVPTYLATLLNNFKSNVSNLVYKGVYSSSITYYPNNIVSYNNNLYYCKITSGTVINKTPTNTSYWLYLGLQGDQGFPTLGVTLKGHWSSNEVYAEKDVVVYSNRLYIATQASTGEVPVSTSSYWDFFVDCDLAKINIGTANLKDGDIYIQEIS